MFRAMPGWYCALAALFSLYYGVRGVVGHRIAAEQQNQRFAKEGLRLVKGWELVLIRYVQDFVFNVVCSVAGFLSLFLSYSVASRLSDFSQLSSGTAILLGGSFVVGIAGVTGQLAVLLLEGRLPKPG